MTRKVTYRAIQGYFVDGEVKTLYYELKGDFYDICGLLRGQLLNCDYPWVAVTRVDKEDEGTVAWYVNDCGVYPVALWRDLAATPEELWKELEDID